jgi:Uma2 family endonuclease
MVSPSTKLTLDQFLALPEGQGDITYELVDGQAVAKVSPKYFHSTLQAALIILIRAWCRGKGRVCSAWAIILRQQEQPWVPVPDLTYISYERLPASWKQNQACPALPELVIEIISAEQTVKEFEDKAKDYLAAGVSLVWVVKPQTQSITVFASDGISQIYTDNTPIVNSLPPILELTLRQVFAEAELV